MERRQFGINSITAFGLSKAAIEEKVPESLSVRWVWFLGASGREKDGLVHFYCLANAPKSPVSSIIHSVPLPPVSCPLVPSLLLPNPLFLFPDFLCCFFLLSVLRALELNHRYIKDDLPIGSIVFVKQSLQHSLTSSLFFGFLNLKELKSVFKSGGTSGPTRPSLLDQTYSETYLFIYLFFVNT